MSTTYKHYTDADGNPMQVESAVRDGKGKNIENNYVKHNTYDETLRVGNSDQLVASVGVTDKVPYNFRTAGGSADIGNRLNDKLVGGTIAWNQIQNDLPTLTRGGITRTKIGNGWYHFEGTSTSYAIFSTASAQPNHVMLIDYEYRVAEGTYQIPLKHDNIGTVSSSRVIKVPSSLAFYMYVEESDKVIDMDAKWMLFDLTQMFGSTIADHIYSLEQATAGAGVAWFKKLFPKPYYEYNAGELMSVCTNAHITRGFNAWDEVVQNGYSVSAIDGVAYPTTGYWCSKNYIDVLPNVQYHITSSKTSWYCNVRWYDAEKNYVGYTSVYNNFTIPSNVRFMKFNGYSGSYSHDICINLSWSGYRNGEYEPYVEHRYPLSPIELRGIPKLDSANNLYYDGDTYEKDGTVTRRFGIVDLGTINWVKGAKGDKWCFYSDFQTYIKYRGYLLCEIYELSPEVNPWENIDNKKFFVTNTRRIVIGDYDFDSVNAFKDAMSGVYLVYELETPTAETANPFADPQIVNDFGTEEYVDALATAETNPRDVAIPVGHETFYQANLRDKLQNLPANANADGLYLVKQNGNKQELIAYMPAMDFIAESQKYAFVSGDGGYIRKWNKDSSNVAFVECGLFAETVATGETTIEIPFAYDNTNYFIDANAVELGNFHVCAFPVDGSHISIRASGVNGSTYVAIPLSIQIKGYTQIS